MARLIKATIQLHRGLAATWARNNPILAYGEPGFEKDTYKLKIGDGISPWNDLPYFADNSYEITPDEKSVIIAEDILALYGFKEAENGQLPTKGSNGKLTWKDPPICSGYYYNGIFYMDPEHTVRYTSNINTLYLDKETNKAYIYNDEYVCLVDNLNQASASKPGIMKLYNTTGNNTDGTMTQKSISDELNEKVEALIDYPEEMLILS